MTETPEGNSHDPQQLAAILGVLFVAAWAALGFGDALPCLSGAAVFYLATAIYRGELDLAELQQRSQPAPPVRLAERTNPLLGSVSVNTRRVTVLKLSSAPVLLTPALSVCDTCARSNDVPGAEALGHMRLIYRKHRTARGPSTAAHPTEG
jgi:hypothetical protein